MLDKIKAEPALFYTFVSSLIGLLMAFGLKLDAAQVAGIGFFVTSSMGLVIRKLVTPVAVLPPVV